MPRHRGKVKVSVEKAARELGYKIVDSNGKHQIGFYKYQTTTRNGQRCSSAKGYLVPADGRRNLNIVDKAFVTKILFDKSKRTVGVMFDHGGKRHVVGARREVIVSCGTINTPALLMRSGIGPKAHLEKLKIPLVEDLPSVGFNFQDHVGIYELFELTKEKKTIRQKLETEKNIRRYINSGKGILSVPDGISYLTFINSDTGKEYPQFLQGLAEFWASPLLQKAWNLKPEVYDIVHRPYENKPLLICGVFHTNPKSRGYVRLNSSNSFDSPIINPNYFQRQQDVDDVVAGLKSCMEIAKTQAMRNAGLKFTHSLFPDCKHLVNNIDEYLRCKVRSQPKTFSHYAGTSKMGSPSDPTTVVDPELRVKGIKGLRIVDASVMPLITSGNINAPTMMIGEKAADIIKDSINCP